MIDEPEDRPVEDGDEDVELDPNPEAFARYADELREAAEAFGD